ncbi:MAG: hypothetical protein V4547_01360 [Bacteroidota bacterium]
MGKFIKNFFFVLMPFFLFVVLVNYFGDAAHLFSNKYVEQISENLLVGKNVTNISNYDERLLEKYLINNKSTCPEVVVLGSSRTMLINSNYFKNQSFSNNSVSGSSIEDLVAVFHLYEQNNCIPKKIILGLDPWTLNINNGQTRWLTLNREFYDLSNHLTNSHKISKEDYINSKYYQLISPSYFKSSIKKLFLKSDPIITDRRNNKTLTKLVDGSINYDERNRNPTTVQVEMAVLDYLNNSIYGVEKFDTLSPETTLLLDKFVKHLKSKNIEVVFFLAPYHIKVYSFLAKSEKYRQVIESEKYFIKLGEKYKIKIIGSFNPNILNLDNSYFFDGMHCTEQGIEKIMSQGK